MKNLFLFLASLLPAISDGAAWTAAAEEKLPAPAGVIFTRHAVRNDAGQSAALHLVRFNAKTHTLAVMDDPASSFDLSTAAQKRGALAAVNGGYFHPDRTPLGLVVRQGEQLHALEKARLLSGLVVVTRDRISLQRTGEFKGAGSVREALQAGPFLVDRGAAVAGLNTSRSAARTFVFAQRGEQFGLGICTAVTLAEMAEILVHLELSPGGRIVRALNLDGGSSTGMWVGAEPAFYLREARDVRNFLAIVPR